MIGVERVAQAERIGGDAGSDRERTGRVEPVSGRRDDEQEDPESDDVQADDDGRHPADPPPLLSGQRLPGPLPPSPARLPESPHVH